MYLSLIGLLVALGLLVFLVYRGFSTPVATIVCSVIVALTAGIPVLTALQQYYLEGFTTAAKNYLLLFGVGGLFGVIMDESGAADAFAQFISGILGKKNAVYAAMLATMLLTWGGVSGFVVCFTVFPIFLSLFMELNLPKRLIPGLMYGSASGLVNCSLPGVPSPVNVIPAQKLGTSPMAALDICIVTSIVGIILIYFYVEYELRKARRKGEVFVPSQSDMERLERGQNRPKVNKWLSMLPMIAIFVALNVFRLDAVYSLFVGCVVGIVLFWRLLGNKVSMLNKGYNGISVVLSVGSAVAFGYVVRNTAGFQAIVDTISNIKGDPLISLGVVTNIVAGALASGTGAVAFVTEVFAPQYIAMGLNPELVHRIIAIGTQGFDSIPQNGSVVTYIEIAGCTHKESYTPIFVTTVIVPLILLVIAIVMANMFYPVYQVPVPAL